MNYRTVASTNEFVWIPSFDLSASEIDARYVRINMLESTSRWGYAISELEIQGTYYHNIGIDKAISGGKATVADDLIETMVGNQVVVTVVPDEGKCLVPGSLKYNGFPIENDMFTNTL